MINVGGSGLSGALFAFLMKLLSGHGIVVFFVSIRKPIDRVIILALASDQYAPSAILRKLAAFWPAI